MLTNTETEKSNVARNYLFEAAVTAKVHNPEDNVYAILDAKSDSGIKVNNQKVWIECKRVTNIDKVEANVRKAREQLDKIFKSKLGSSHRGIIAVDVTKIINPNNDIYVATNDMTLALSIQRQMDSFIEKHHYLWQRLLDGRSKK